ncbi:hypothetical protein P7C73_g1897, partial [Tremellales sp. Uapishka_1]
MEQQRQPDIPDRPRFNRTYILTASPSLGKRLFVKRSSSPKEYCADKDIAGTPFYPRGRSKESLENEALAIEFVRKHTTIPVPTVVAAFDGGECFFLIEEYIEGAVSAHLVKDPAGNRRIHDQLEEYMGQLRTLRSGTLRSFTDSVHIGRSMRQNYPLLSHAKYIVDEISKPYVLTHGDLAWHNILVDPVTFEILAIIDWETAGFFPPEVEGSYRLKRTYSFTEGGPDDPNNLVRTMYELALPTLEPDRRNETETVHMVEDSSESGKVEISADDEYNKILDPKQPTPLQKRLQRLEIGLPEGIRVNQDTLAYQTGVACRREIVHLYQELYNDLNEEVLALESQNPPEHASRSNTEAVHLLKLHTLLPKLHQTLSLSLAQSISTLENHVAALSAVQLTEDRLRQTTSSDVDHTVAQLYQRIEQKMDETAAKQRTEFEKCTWDAFYEFSDRLLLVSHVGRKLVGFIQPDGKPATQTEELLDLAARARDLLGGGTGGLQHQLRESPIRTTEAAEARRNEYPLQKDRRRKGWGRVLQRLQTLRNGQRLKKN